MKILIVDDSKAMRMIVKRTLRQAGYDDHATEEAVSGSEAMKFIEESPPDVLLLDWNMPGMSGMEVVEELKKSNSQVKFGFVTSEGTAAMKKRALEAGAMFFISKPFTVETFQQALSGVLS